MKSHRYICRECHCPIKFIDTLDKEVSMWYCKNKKCQRNQGYWQDIQSGEPSFVLDLQNCGEFKFLGKRIATEHLYQKIKGIDKEKYEGFPTVEEYRRYDKIMVEIIGILLEKLF